MTTVVVVIPDPPLGILVASGVVCQTLPAGERTSVWYEGNLYGAPANIVTYADRVYHAADRMLGDYPTSATAALPSKYLLVIGTFDTHTGTVTLDGDSQRRLLADWLGVEQVADSELATTVSTHIMRRMRHPSRLSGETVLTLAERLAVVKRRTDIEILDLVRIDPADVSLGGPFGTASGLVLTVAFAYTTGRRQQRTARLAWPIRHPVQPGQARDNLPACLWADINRRIGGVR
jgi:hypothetical protein